MQTPGEQLPFPIQDDPFTLATNCRNTGEIHDAVYLYYKGPRVAPPRIRGLKVGLIAFSSIAAQAQKLHSRIVELISREGVSPDDIAVLIADSLQKTLLYKALRHQPLPKPAKWVEEDIQTENTVLLDTVKRFKGLESPVVFLWGFDALDLNAEAEILYVGMSRAKSLLYLVGQRVVCKHVLAIK